MFDTFDSYVSNSCSVTDFASTASDKPNILTNILQKQDHSGNIDPAWRGSFFSGVPPPPTFQMLPRPMCMGNKAVDALP
jgi:hypothetical protein